jgi:hypothetical protein
MEIQTYTEDEFYNKINLLKNNGTRIQTDTDIVHTVYKITIESEHKQMIIDIMNNISKYCIHEYDMDMYDLFVIYNNILINIDLERDWLYLTYNKCDVKPADIDLILDTFLFLQPKYYDEEYEMYKLKLELDERKKEQAIIAEEMRIQIEQTRKEKKDLQTQRMSKGWRAFVETFQDNCHI